MNEESSCQQSKRRFSDRAESESAQMAHQEPTALASGWRAGKAEWLIIIILAFIALMVALDATILVPVLPALARDLRGTSIETFWTGTAYLLTQSVFQPFLVSLSDVFGRRWIYQTSLSLFTIGTLVCCLSRNFTQLLAGRAVQGIGGGGLLTLGQVIVTDIVPLRQRPLYLSVNQLSWAVGSIIGPLLGGLFAQHTTWRWIFYINFPFCAIGLLTVPWVMRLHAQRSSLRERVLHVDWLGSLFFIASTCSFLIGVTWGGVQFPWSSWRTLVPIIVGFAGVVATVVWERYGAPKPFLRLELFTSFSAITAYTCAVLQGVLLAGELYYIPFYLETVKDFSPTATGAALMPIMAVLVPGSIIVGVLMTRFGRFRWAVWSGWAVTIAGTGLLILLDADIKAYGWALIFVFVGVGHGLVVMSLNIAIQAMAETRHVAYAAAMYIFTRTLGMCLGVAIGGTVFQNRLSKHLGDLQLPTAVATDAEAFVASIKALPRSSTEYQAYILAYSESFKNVFQVLTAVAGLAGLLSVFIKDFTMDKELDSEHVLQHRTKESSALEANAN